MKKIISSGVKVKLTDNVVELRKSVGLPAEADFGPSMGKVLVVQSFDSRHKVINRKTNKNVSEDLYRLSGGQIEVGSWYSKKKTSLSIHELLIPRSAFIVAE